MKNIKIVMILILFVTLRSAYGQDIPKTRRYEWGEAGLSQSKFTASVKLNISDFNADSTGRTSNNLAFESALEYLDGRSGTVYFPEGKFLFTHPIKLRDSIILKGVGKETQLLFDLGGNEHAIVIAGQSRTLSNSLLKSAFKRTKYLEFQNADDLDPGDIIKVCQSNKNKTTSDWADYSIAQILKLIHVDANGTVYTDNWLRMNFKLIDQIKIEKIDAAQQIGLECLSLTRLDETSTQTSTVFIENAMNIWIENVESHHSNFAHVEVKSATNVEISNSYFYNAHSFGNGGKGYGVVLHFSSGECKIENNIFNKLRHSILLQAGANGNVIGYNYSVAPHWTDVALPADAAGDIVLHGNYPFANLFEGNVVQNIVIDDSHGVNGPDNVFYRNEIQGYGLVMNFTEPSDSQAFIGNVISNESIIKGLFYLSGSGHYLNSNYVKGEQQPSNSTDLHENSLYDVESTFRITSQKSNNRTKIQASERFSTKKFTSCKAEISTNLNNLNHYDLSVFPNPARAQVSISGHHESLQIYNLLGMQMPTYKITEGKYDVSTYKPGIYFIHTNDMGLNHQSIRMVVK